MSTPAAFLNFLDSYQFFLGLPIKLFILGSVFVLAQLLIVISYMYGGWVVWTSSALVAIGGGLLFRRYVKLASFMEGTTSHMAQVDAAAIDMRNASLRP